MISSTPLDMATDLPLYRPGGNTTIGLVSVNEYKYIWAPVLRVRNLSSVFVDDKLALQPQLGGDNRL